jgi:sugar O-acyltransferase (sialic acid O-acetyltransferase NeuD family)
MGGIVLNINVFGKGEVYKQISPHLGKRDIVVNHAVDDFTTPNIDNMLLEEGFEVLFCVGYKDLHKRLQRYHDLQKKGVRFISFQAENAVVSDQAKVNNGTIINQAAIIDNYAVVGEACFVNIGVIINHDAVIGDGTFIAPGACICGFVTVGEECFIGANATIIDHIEVGKGAVIAAGAVVIHDVPDYAMVAGNPAVVKKYYK